MVQRRGKRRVSEKKKGLRRPDYNLHVNCIVTLGLKQIGASLYY